METKFLHTRKLLNQLIRNPAYFQESKRFNRQAIQDALKKKKEIFQREDGIPVYIKGGTGDKILFLFTSLLCATGVASGMYTVLGMAFKGRK